MNLNWPVIIILGVVVLALLIFVIRRNFKDKKELESTMNQVDQKPLEHDSDNEAKT